MDNLLTFARQFRGGGRQLGGDAGVMHTQRGQKEVRRPPAGTIGPLSLARPPTWSALRWVR